ncbi:MAG: YedE-related selenium metabolism membrane protein, partial [Oscillospiraceae bacterium]|nr:YedE-related selenium metabolism membrane protein [Oscillospiraceae bacterium]
MSWSYLTDHACIGPAALAAAAGPLIWDSGVRRKAASSGPGRKRSKRTGRFFSMEKSNSHLLVILTGLVVGAAAIVLAAFGNPGNMGFCIACFIRDIAGGVKMHTAPVVQYVRPEIIGIVLGSMVMALIGGEFKAKGGSAPVSRFVLGFFVMVGALMFLGCPLRMVIRLGGGDGNALFGLLGFVLGVWVGTIFLGKGFTFKRAYNMPTLEGYALPAINVVLLVLLLMGAGVAAANAAAAKAAADAGTEAPEMAKTLLAFSLKGPGSMHAPIYIALIAGLVVGALAQKSRLCMAGGIRDAIMLKDLHLLWGFIAIFVTVLVGNLCLHSFKLGFAGQPVAHSSHLWNLLGMTLCGWACVL